MGGVNDAKWSRRLPGGLWVNLVSQRRKKALFRYFTEYVADGDVPFGGFLLLMHDIIVLGDIEGRLPKYAPERPGRKVPKDRGR